MELIGTVAEFIIEYWYILIGIAALSVAAFFMITGHKKNIIRWLEGMCLKAEIELGSKTGQAKLRQVYDYFIAKYPKTALVISFDTFSKWVKESLIWLNKQMEENPKIKELTNS